MVDYLKLQDEIRAELEQKQKEYDEQSKCIEINVQELQWRIKKQKEQKTLKFKIKRWFAKRRRDIA